MKTYRAGSIFKFDYEHDGIVEKNHLFFLAKTFEKGYVFEIICIKGYHAGEKEGYIKKESGIAHKISKEHLKKELNNNFIKIQWDTFEDSIEI